MLCTVAMQAKKKANDGSESDEFEASEDGGSDAEATGAGVAAQPRARRAAAAKPANYIEIKVQSGVAEEGAVCRGN